MTPGRQAAGIVWLNRPPRRKGSARVARPVASSVSTNNPQSVASPSAGARRSPGTFFQKRSAAPPYSMPITLS